VRYTKWDGTPPWSCATVYLGEDNHGRWVGQPFGTVVERPGVRFESPWYIVVLIPDAGHVAGFYRLPAADVAYTGPGFEVDTYVDITTVPTWDRTDAESEVTMVDLDLDVVKQLDGHIFVDDADEFAEHQVAMAIRRTRAIAFSEASRTTSAPLRCIFLRRTDCAQPFSAQPA